MRDYSRQESIFEQQKLIESKIIVVGASQLSNYFCTYLAGLGIGNLTIFDDVGNKGFMLNKEDDIKPLEEKLKEMNEELNVEVLRHYFDPYFIGRADVLLDLTNNPETKSLTREFSIRQRIPYISASTAEDHGCITVMQPRGKLESFFNPCKSKHFDKYKNKRQGTFSSGIIAAIALDEVRKNIMPLKGDSLTDGLIEYNLLKEKRFAEDNNTVKEAAFQLNQDDKVLIIGAGGTGMYAALNLAQLGSNIHIFDKDKIEEHNLNRQVFYHGSIGKNKAETLKARLQEFFPCTIKATARNFKKKDIDSVEKYSAIFSCVDNPESRLLLNKAALRHKVPIIDAAVSAFSARLEFFVPGKSNCLACKRGRQYYNRKGKTESCATLAAPNVVMCNAFVGAMASAEYKLLQKNKSNLLDKRFTYLSKPARTDKFIISKEEDNACFDTKCLCKLLKKKEGSA